jgi:hypothetical protein
MIFLWFNQIKKDRENSYIRKTVIKIIERFVAALILC